MSAFKFVPPMSLMQFPINRLRSLVSKIAKLVLCVRHTEENTWLETRSDQGYEVVKVRLENLRSHSVLVSQLNDPDTQVIYPNPQDSQWQNLTLEELRDQLGLTTILQDQQIKRITYSDRYLQPQEAEILADLLQGIGLQAKTQNISAYS